MILFHVVLGSKKWWVWRVKEILFSKFLFSACVVAPVYKRASLLSSLLFALAAQQLQGGHQFIVAFVALQPEFCCHFAFL